MEAEVGSLLGGDCNERVTLKVSFSLSTFGLSDDDDDDDGDDDDDDDGFVHLLLWWDSFSPAKQEDPKPFGPPTPPNRNTPPEIRPYDGLINHLVKLVRPHTTSPQMVV